jgi:hypothetical protein
MKEYESQNSKNQEECQKTKIIFENNDYFIECNGKLYKLINDTLIEITTTDSTNKN